jgi:tRNA1(Val) A37 N6-methylase TrmN6
MLLESEPKYLTVREAAEQLGVSTATVNNWVKLNTINTVRNNKYFENSEIIRFKTKVVQENKAKLSSRANKTNTIRTFIPAEYLSDSSSLPAIETIVNFIFEVKLKIEKVLFFLSINQLVAAGILEYEITENEIICISPHSFVTSFIKDWLSELVFTNFDKYSFLLTTILPKNELDLLGVFYQSLKHEGDKSKNGSYYTPATIVENARKYVTSQTKILDPCCGTGQFLTQLKAPNSTQLFGMDIDKLAVKLAKVNLFLAYPTTNFEPQIYHKDFILGLELNGIFKDNTFSDFDLIATNPPWGFRFDISTKNQIKQQYSQIESTESFALFLYNSMQLLKQKGFLSFVLPESFLNVKTHTGIRKYIFKNHKILRIKYLNRVFKNVFTPVLQFDVQKSTEKYTNFEIEIAGKITQYDILKIKQNADYSIHIKQDENADKILQKVHQVPHLTLKNNADFALGIVTGNNEKWLFSTHLQNLEPIYKGKDVQRFKFSDPSNFIDFQPVNFQQIAPESKYRASQKLVYRFISKELVFALDTKQSLTLNSANIVIPTLNYPVKTILALFNSRLYQFVFQKKFNSIKVLRNHIEALPLPILTEKLHQKIEEVVSALIQENNSKLDNELNEIVYSIFGITESDITNF